MKSHHLRLGLVTLLSGAALSLFNSARSQSTAEPDNKLSDWMSQSHTVSPYSYSAQVATDVSYNHKPVARISSTKADQPTDYYIYLFRNFSPNAYLGKRVEFSCAAEGSLKTGEANLVAIVHNGNKPIKFDSMKDRPMALTDKWQKQFIVMDVPKESTKITIGIALKGGGTLDVSDLQFHVVDKSIATTSSGPIDSKAYESYAHDLPDAPRNIDFDEVGAEMGPKGIVDWDTVLGDRDHPDYAMSRDDQKQLNGKSSATISATKDRPKSFAMIRQDVSAEDYRGKKMKFSAQVQCKDVKDWSALWLRVDSADQVLAFDNMEKRPLKGTFDWKPESIVVEIPKEARKIRFGFMQAGAGQSWYSNVAFKPAEVSEAITATKERVPEIHSLEKLSNEPNLEITSK